MLNISSIRPEGPRGSAASKKRAGGDFKLKAGAGAETATAPKAAEGPQNVGALFAVQATSGTDADKGRRRRAVVAGERTLDLLDAMRVEILSGTPSLTRLREIAAAAEQASGAGDPALDSVLAEIRLRARVEIAKNRMNSTTS